MTMPTASLLLLVDDDPSVCRGLHRAMVQAGYLVQVEDDGETALFLAEARAFDLIILDVRWSRLDELMICRRLRAQSTTPILLLSARDAVPDRVAGLDAGADYYLVKPFATEELLARVRALLRRSQAQETDTLSYADLALKVATHEAWRVDQPLHLSPIEFELAATFLRHPRQVLSRDQLCQTVWGYEFAGESNFVDVAVKELRKHMEATGAPRLIQTVRGFGYVLRKE
jgi:two-component system, OmpR family, response regulator MprA